MVTLSISDNKCLDNDAELEKLFEEWCNIVFNDYTKPEANKLYYLPPRSKVIDAFRFILAFQTIIIMILIKIV